jgi:hypothetical protein
MADSTLKAYQDRWKQIADLERREQRAASMDLRWRQTNAIFALALGLGLPFDQQGMEEAIVRQRWEKLKGRL